MGKLHDRDLRYAILDPTGNITLLVESEVAVERQPEVAAGLMRLHPGVEQVGFVSLELPKDDSACAELRMAGGEFCGNATMSAAALWLMRRDAAREASASGNARPERVLLRVSGFSAPVEVRLRRCMDGSVAGAVRMPQALGVNEVELPLSPRAERLPVVAMEGISHVVIERGRGAYRLLEERPVAQEIACSWCELLGSDGLGLMFVDRSPSRCLLTPLVYVPASGTTFWENSCASGSAAVGMYLATGQGAPVALDLEQPGGTLHVESTPGGATWLHGKVRMLEEFR